MIDTEKLYAQVALESWQDVNAVYRESIAENGDTDLDSYENMGSELNLYVFADGRWTIDHPQYIATTNGCISCVPIGLYNGPNELADDIEANEDWDTIEEYENE